jgi:hypothetical protein
MFEISIEKSDKTIKISDLSPLTLPEKQRLIDVFAWLIKEDKKQNPELYLIKKVKQND